MNDTWRLSHDFDRCKDALIDDLNIVEGHVCHTCRSRSRVTFTQTVPWMICLVLAIGLGLSVAQSSRTCAAASFWRQSDFETIKRDVPAEFEEVRFEATLKYNESHQVYRPVTTPSFVGEPSPEIDAAWKELLGAVNVFVTPKEEKFIGENLWLDPETGLHMAQMTVFHDLHCVNMIRKALYLEYYPELKDYTLRSHVEHCIDALRLSIMCTGDSTFIPIKWSENRNWIIPIFETVHTCRNYDALKKWSLDRDAADPKTLHENAERLKNKGA